MPLQPPAPEAPPALLLELLKKHGHDHFRPGQLETIRSVLSGRPTLAVMPTGGGKSLCYMLPAELVPGITLVVSPLVALMHDQLRRLRALGIPSEAIDGHQSESEPLVAARRDDPAGMPRNRDGPATAPVPGGGRSKSQIETA